MSRIGKLPIAIPKGVEVKLDGDTIHVKGPKGSLQQKIDDTVVVRIDNDTIHVELPEHGRGENKWQGLYRSLIANMVQGVTTGFKKQLELIGVGFRAAVKGTQLDLQLGFSHPTIVDIPDGLTVAVEKSIITIEGADKQLCGHFAATVRDLRPPEPYQGKGIRYLGEYVRRKAGKAAAKK